MLSTLQQAIERSIFEAIRKVLVDEGYTPDISNTVRYPIDTNPTLAQTNWNTDLATIARTKGFAVEIFGEGSPDARGTKKVPRIVIESMRSMPSEVGAPLDGILQDNPADATTVLRQPLPYRASTFVFDLHLVTNSANQIRVLNAVLGKALGNLHYIPFYDDASQGFLVEQTSYYDVPDTLEGLIEKVYSYQAPDLYDYVEDEAKPVKKIVQIDIQVTMVSTDVDFESLPQSATPDKSTEGGGIRVDDNGTIFT